MKTADDAGLVDDGWNDKVSSLVSGSAAARVGESGAVYTLPARNEIRLQLGVDLSNVTVRVFDMAGRQLMAVTGKSGTIYLLDAAHMGKFDPTGDTGVVQSIPLAAYRRPRHTRKHLPAIAVDCPWWPCYAPDVLREGP